MKNEKEWERCFRDVLAQGEEGDPAHDLTHIVRVVKNAYLLTQEEEAEWAIVMPAAWLHDCVHVPKDSPQRAEASRLAADYAVEVLERLDFPSQNLEAIHHAIHAHSFSAGVKTETLEAKVLQDADRIDALGAVGLSRCLMLGGHLGTALMSPEDPFCETRAPDDSKFTIDHFYRKLLRLENTMQTKSGRTLAAQRSEVLRSFLQQLKSETQG